MNKHIQMITAIVIGGRNYRDYRHATKAWAREVFHGLQRRAYLKHSSYGSYDPNSFYARQWNRQYEIKAKAIRRSKEIFKKLLEK